MQNVVEFETYEIALTVAHSPSELQNNNGFLYIYHIHW